MSHVCLCNLRTALPAALLSVCGVRQAGAVVGGERRGVQGPQHGLMDRASFLSQGQELRLLMLFGVKD